MAPSSVRGTSMEGNCSFDTMTSADDDEVKIESKVCSRKHLLKPPKFDGTRCFEAFWAQFCNCAKYNKWSRKDRLIFLRDSLKDDATNVLWDYGNEVTSSLSNHRCKKRSRKNKKTLKNVKNVARIKNV